MLISVDQTDAEFESSLYLYDLGFFFKRELLR